MVKAMIAKLPSYRLLFTLVVVISYLMTPGKIIICKNNSFDMGKTDSMFKGVFIFSIPINSGES